MELGLQGGPLINVRRHPLDVIGGRPRVPSFVSWICLPLFLFCCGCNTRTGRRPMVRLAGPMECMGFYAQRRWRACREYGPAHNVRQLESHPCSGRCYRERYFCVSRTIAMDTSHRSNKAAEVFDVFMGQRDIHLHDGAE